MNFTGPPLKTWTQAFLLSSSTVSFFVLTLGIGIVPYKADDIWQQTTLSITDCYLPNQGQIAISAVWTHSILGRRDHLVVYPLNCTEPTMQTPWRNLSPTALAGDSQRGFVYVGNSDGTIYSVEPSNPGKSPVLIGRHPGNLVRQLACSRNGRWLASIHDESLYVWDLATKTLHQQWSRGGLNCVALSPDSKSAVCGFDDGNVVEVELVTGRLVRAITKHESPVMKIAYCPRGQHVASLSLTGRLRLTNSVTNTDLWEHRQGWSPHVLTYSNDGETLISSGQIDKQLGLIAYQIRTGNRIATMKGHGKAIRGATVDGDGRVVAWGADGTLRFWDYSSQNNLRSPKTPHQGGLFATDDRVIMPQWQSLGESNDPSVAKS